MSSRVLAVLGLTLVVSAVERASAQQPVLRRDLPEPVPADCRVIHTPSRAAQPQDAEEASRLLASAREAVLLGDAPRARDLLERAASTDTTAASVAFLLARTLEQLREPDAAAGEYCRYLRLAGDPSDAAEVTRTIARIARPVRVGLSDSAVAVFQNALALADADRLAEAEAAFTATIETAPRWPTAYYDRALLRARLGLHAAARSDLEQYLALEPSAEDALAVRAWLAQLATARRTYSPGAAFALGLIPGAGHFYTGRPLVGATLLVVSGGAAAVGVLFERRHVECLGAPVDGECPAGQVRDERIERPYLLVGAGVAAAAALIGAIDAARGAGSRNADAILETGAGIGSAIETRGGRIDVALLRVRF